MKTKLANQTMSSNFDQCLSWFNKSIMPIVTTKHTQHFKPVVPGRI